MAYKLSQNHIPTISLPSFVAQQLQSSAAATA
jgi:hypothetical protein